MTRLVAQELEAREIGFSNLHGGIPSQDRQALIENFTKDPECRIFLSTDAGGVGLNLQAASMVINLDVPWNPAVLEQRVGRIYRMGQEKNIRVINMVSIETIEQRMLGVLDFKASMAQGVLDPDGDDTIFMSETKFKKFMENVEDLTSGENWQAGPVSEDAVQEQAESEDFEVQPMPSVPTTTEAAGASPEKSGKAPSTPQPRRETFAGDDDVAPGEPTANRPPPSGTPETREEKAPNAPKPSGEGDGPVDANTGGKIGSGHLAPVGGPSTPQDLIHTGVSFFAGLAQTLSSPEKTQELVQSIVAKDETTGQTYLKIPVESAAVVENAMKLLGGLFAGLGQKSSRE